MAVGQDGLSKADRRRAQELELAGRIGGQFGLGTIDEVVRHWRDRGCLLGIGSALGVGALVWGIGGLFLIVLPRGDQLTKEVFGVIIGVVLVLGVLLLVLGERFKVVDDWYFLYSGGVAQVARREPEPRVLRWPDVETVTVTVETEDGELKTEVAICVVSGPGTEMTAHLNSDAFDEAPGRTVAAAAYRNLALRLVPPLIQAWESGEPVTAGGLSVDQEGITVPAGTRHAWSEITTMTVEYASGRDPAPITLIKFRRAGTDRNYRISLSGIPNGIFLAHLIVHAATGHGVQVDGYRRP